MLLMLLVVGLKAVNDSIKTIHNDDDSLLFQWLLCIETTIPSLRKLKAFLPSYPTFSDVLNPKCLPAVVRVQARPLKQKSWARSLYLIIIHLLASQQLQRHTFSHSEQTYTGEIRLHNFLSTFKFLSLNLPSTAEVQINSNFRNFWIGEYSCCTFATLFRNHFSHWKIIFHSDFVRKIVGLVGQVDTV